MMHGPTNIKSTVAFIYSFIYLLAPSKTCTGSIQLEMTSNESGEWPNLEHYPNNIMQDSTSQNRGLNYGSKEHNAKLETTGSKRHARLLIPNIVRYGGPR